MMKIMDSNDKIPRYEWAMANKMAEQADANAAFARLPKAKQRVAIAKDVLKWLSTGKLRAMKQVYIEPGEGVEEYGQVNGYSCEACALGSLLTVAVEYGLCGGNLYGAHYWWGPIIRRKLRAVFSGPQLGLIEIAFEGPHTVPNTDSHTGAPQDAYYVAGGFPGRCTNPADITRSERFNLKVRSPRQRMVRIMENIIRNKGEFKP